MKKLLSLLVLILSVVAINAQILKPVKWSFSTEQVSATEYKLIFKAKIDDGWYLYSQDIAEDGPIPTTFTFENTGSAKLNGKPSESGEKTKEGIDEMFDVFIRKFGKSATFVQNVSITENTKVTGYLEFMTCDDERCLPPEIVDFSFDLVANNTEGNSGNTIEEKKNETVAESITEVNEVVETAKNTENNTETAVVDTDNELNEQQNQGILEPVKWEVFTEEVSPTETRVTYKAKIDEGWYLYSQNLGGEGPVPTTFYADKNYEEIIKFEEVSDYLLSGFDSVFEINVNKYKKEVSFTKVFNNEVGTINGMFEFMTCTNGMCLPPEGYYVRNDLANLKSEISKNPFEEEATTSNNGTCEHLDLGLDGNFNQETEGEEEKDKGAWLIFLLGFGGGLLALLTPCVFPMIPLTVSFFTKSSQTKNGKFQAILYGFSIFLIYVLLSAPFHLLDLAPTVLHQISTGVVLNLVFFAIFVFFAFSFFGYYEITLPSGLANRVSKAESTGGIIGVFFMALTLAIVSFSCTGPIIGSLLAGTLTKGAWLLTAGMAGFGVALGLPFALFALFPSMLNKLPQSGGWMNTVKVILGFIELAFAFKFLSNADLVHHWGLLKREIFFGIWVLIAFLMGLYMLGVIKFPHDSPMKKLKPSRIVLALIFFGFSAYFAPGLFGKNVPLLSGFAPPMYYKLFKGDTNNSNSLIAADVKEKYGFSDECPNGIPCNKDFFKSEEYGLDYDKPVLIDFTGYACVNCRKMEEQVWIQENITNILANEVTLASLYVDDRTELGEDEMCIGTYGEDIKQNVRNVGLKWSFFEIINFEQNSQPLYVLIDPRDREILMDPIGYTPDAKEYEQLLLEGIEKYKSKSL